jgi:iron complex transport system ATP-binding protein
MTDLVARQACLAGRITDVDFKLATGELVAIVGPNGSGKTSLLRVLAGQRHPDGGAALLNNQPVQGIAPRTRARQLAYLPQRSDVAWPISVAAMVRLGRFAFGDAPDGGDDDVVEQCLGELGCDHLRSRSTATLSGGELALVALARVFAAETPLLLLDEPTAALDPRRQLDLMARLAARARTGQGIAVVLHDLNLAAQFADRIVWMKHGRVAAESRCDRDALIAHSGAVFDVTIRVDTDNADRITSLAILG